MFHTKRKAFILLVSWFCAIVLYGAYSAYQEYDRFSIDLKSQARNLQQELSQRADQHDVYLSAISSLLGATTPPALDLVLGMTTNMQRFYQRVISIDIVALSEDAPKRLILSSGEREVSPQQVDELISRLQESAVGALVLYGNKDQASDYFLVKRSPNTDAARYGIALRINLAKLISDGIDANSETRIQLSLPDGTQLYETDEGDWAQSSTGLLDPILWQGKLSSASQPLLLKVERRLTLGDLLKPAEIALLAVLFGLIALIVLALLQQIAKTRLSETKARLGEQETRLAHGLRINALGEMASGITHELTQPLAAILSQSQAAVRLLDQEVPDLETLRTALDANVRQSKRAGQLLTRFRNWAKPGTDEKIDVDLNKVATNIEELLRDENAKRSIKVRFELGDPAPIVTGDSVQLEQVIFNLVRNAADAIEAADGVRREIVIATTAKDGLAEILVLDSGDGIPAHVLERLTEPFFTTKSEGMGLGLTLCDNIIGRMEGEISFQNLQDWGAQAVVRIPIAKGEAA